MPTFTNPKDPTQTYETGKRGKPASWLKDLPEYIAWRTEADKLKATPAQKQATLEAVAENALKTWQWVGLNAQEGEDARAKDTSMCVVAAYNSSDAVLLLCKRFRNPVTKYEFSTMWRQVAVDDAIDKPGVYQHNEAKVLVAVTV